MKVVINSYSRLAHLELGVSISIEDIKNILPNLTDWQAQVVLARLAREHDEGVFYDAAIEQIDKWGKEMYPRESSAKTS